MTKSQKLKNAPQIVEAMRATKSTVHVVIFRGTRSYHLTKGGQEIDGKTFLDMLNARTITPIKNPLDPTNPQEYELRDGPESADNEA